MVDEYLDAADYCKRVIDPMIAVLGVKVAFAVNGILLVYSGPTKDISNLVGKHVPTNWERAKDDMAVRLGATIIDNTPVGQTISSVNFWQSFGKACNYNDSILNDITVEVWSYASRELARAAFKEVYTVICGANPKNVFRKIEQEEIVKNPLIEIVNKRPRELFEGFHGLHPYYAFRLMEGTELLLARVYMNGLTSLHEKAHAWNDFLDRQLFMHQAWHDERPDAPRFSPDIEKEIRMAQRELLKRYPQIPIVGSIPTFTSPLALTGIVSGHAAPPLIHYAH